jgi:glycosyltransferase involved in cell wall biosynthesis
MKPVLSVLICTIEGREHLFDRLMANIDAQISNNGLLRGTDIEVCYLRDKKGDSTIGDKRNRLLQECSSEWACFIDDDDLIADDYLARAISILKTDNPDCINLIGSLTTNGQNPETFIHELRHKDYFTKDGIHYRPPNHLNIIRSSIGKLFQFKSLNHGEDTAWAMEICNACVLKTEGRIESITYFYEYVSNK